MNATKRTMGTTMMVLAALLLLAVPAPAADMTPPPEGQLIKLEPTKYGMLLNAEGMAKITDSQKGVETFGVVVFVDVPDGTIYSVEVLTSSKGYFKVADLDMNIGVASVRQTNLTDKTRAFPVAELVSVIIRDGKNVILSGNF